MRKRKPKLKFAPFHAREGYQVEYINRLIIPAKPKVGKPEFFTSDGQITEEEFNKMNGDS